MVRIILLLCFISLPMAMLAQTNGKADFSSLKILRDGNDGEMSDFAVSKDQKYIIVANANKNIKIYEGTSGKFIKRITGHHIDPEEIIITPDNESIISAGLDNKIAVLDIKTGAVKTTIALKNNLRCMDIHSKNNLLAVGDNKGFIYFIDLESGSIIKEMSTGAPQVSSVVFSPDYKHLAVGTGVAVGYMVKKNPILILDVETKQVVKKLQGLEGATTAMRYSYDGSVLYTGHKSNSRTLAKWDLATEQATIINTMFNIISVGGYTSIDIDKKSSVLVSTTDDRSIQIYDLINNQLISNQFATKIRLVRKLDHFPKNVYGVNEGKNFIIGGFNKSLLYIYNAEKKGVAGYIHLYNDDWAVVSADGRMDGSLPAIKNLSWMEGFTNIPLENTFDANFTPRLLNQLTSEETTQTEFKVEQAAKEIPVIKVLSIDGKSFTASAAQSTLRTSKKLISIKLNVEKNQHQVDEIRLYQNSKLVSTLNSKDGLPADLSFQVNLTDAFGQENYFYVTAKSKQGFDSEKTNFIITYEGKTDEKPVLYLFTIGVNEYRNTKYNLNFAVADASGFEEQVKKTSSGLFDNIVVTSLRNNKVTKAAVAAALKDVQAKAKEQDMFIFYYAGHGVMSEATSAQSQFYLVPYDVTQLYGREDMLADKGISASELKELSKGINAQKQVFILDACQSSGALESVAVRGAAEEKALAQLARSTGTFWITATGSQQFATEFAELGHGVFTYSLIEGLAGKADNGDKRITIKELSAYIENRVPELSEKYKGTSQFPSGYSFGNDFPVGIIK
jgi:WD40 repeat protein